GIQFGDLMLASITFFAGARPTPPAGWTAVPGANVMSQSNDQTVVWYRIASNNEPASYTWKWDAVAYPAGTITVWRGVDNANPFDGIKAQVDNGTGDFARAPSVTIKTPNSQLLSIFGAGNASRLNIQGPISTNPSVGADETKAAKVVGGIVGVPGT